MSLSFGTLGVATLQRVSGNQLVPMFKIPCQGSIDNLRQSVSSLPREYFVRSAAALMAVANAF